MALLVFHNESNPLSEIQLSSVKSMSATISTDVISPDDSPRRVGDREVEAIPTTLVVDGDSELWRWEGVAHREEMSAVVEELQDEAQ